MERTPKIEKVNVDGGRFIREAKVNSSRATIVDDIYIVCGVLWYLNILQVNLYRETNFMKFEGLVRIT